MDNPLPDWLEIPVLHQALTREEAMALHQEWEASKAGSLDRPASPQLVAMVRKLELWSMNPKLMTAH